MSRDVLMIVHTMGTLEPSDNDRFTYLAKRLMETDPNVQIEIITSDYEHHKKRYRDKDVATKHPFRITFLHEDSYKKNVSLARIKGHMSFAKRLTEYLKSRKKPDVIYCAVPPLTSAKRVAQYADKTHIKLVIDVQDLWPESFQIALGNSLISKIILHPMMRVADYVYTKADEIYAVSRTFAERTLEKKGKTEQAYSVYLGTDSLQVNSAIERCKKNKPENEVWICYVGNIGASYDFPNLFKALRKVREKGIDNIKFHIVGDGNLREQVEILAKDNFPDTIFHGYIPYDEMFGILCSSDIAVNPIVKSSVSSVVNKVGDYAAAGIPVINTQSSEEYRMLLKSYNAGISTKEEDSESIADAIIQLYRNKDLRIMMGNNNRRLYEELFDRRQTYKSIIRSLLK